MRVLISIVGLFFLLVFSGCSGCDDDCPGGCPEGSVCNAESGLCVNAGECPGGCPAGLACVDGACTTPPIQCQAPQEACDPRFETNDGFLCLSFDGVSASCYEQCQAGECAGGSLCFFVESSLDPACTSNDECGANQACQFGACRDTICQPSECEGPIAGLDTCRALYEGDPNFPNGAICANAGNDASYCFAAGPRTEGESCSALDQALISGNISSLCLPGLGCLGGICRTLCDQNSPCASGDCLLAEESIAGPDTGFCGEQCEPFSQGECGEGESCQPVAADLGLCVPSGDLPAFSRCEPGASQCEDGTFCVVLQEPNAAQGLAGEARCHPICDIRDAPAETDGSVSPTTQALRDSRCPNPPVDPAGIVLAHLATDLEEFDVYVGDSLAGQLEPRSQFNDGVFEVEPRRTTLALRPARGPSTDVPLAEFVFDAESGSTYEIEILAAGSEPEVRAREFALGSVSVIHASTDLGPLDLVGVPSGEEPNDQNQTLFVEGLEPGVSVEAMAFEGDVLVFEAGAERTRFSALIVSELGLTAGEANYVSGTLDALDSAPLEIVNLPIPAPLEPTGGDRFICSSLGNDVFGFCQQTCESSESYLSAETCQGEGMGCAPVFLDDTADWRDICTPIGSSVEGSQCNPFGIAQCQRGLYCQEYGNAAPDFDPQLRGVCHNLCATDGTFGCEAGRECKLIDDDLIAGECAVACESEMFGDASCPTGQNSCLPSASLVLETVGASEPSVRDEPTYCSASGLLAPGEMCSGADCVPQAECLYPRSAQSDFLFSLLSPYVGAQGLVPTCTLRCDPFTSTGCANGETCLFNYPYSADVGHCAPVVESALPGAPCTRPGEACGQDSICVADPAGNLCFRFCEYEGPDSNGVLSQSTCPAGMECAALVADLGVCRDPR